MEKSMTPANLAEISSQAQPQVPAAQGKARQSVSTILNGVLDSEGYRKRLDALLGARSAQFASSIITLVNADKNLQQAAIQAPVTIIQAALKAATFDLPIDPALGYAYIVPFKNTKPDGGAVMEATFVLGYKGMNQLALRTGVYKRLNVCDVREGELKHFDRLMEDIEIEWIEDEDEREKAPIIGWVGYFRLVNGTEKTIYMSRKAIEHHEEKNRKGKYPTKGWRENFNEMAAKTVFRRLVGKYGVMSIVYQRQASAEVIQAAEDAAAGRFDDVPDARLAEENATVV